MRRISALLIAALTGVGFVHAQGRPIDWPNFGGDAQRTGWEKSDSRITKENIKEFQLVLKRKLDNPQTGPYSLTPPVVIGNLISYRGFKELAFVAGSSGTLWAIDADIDRMFWQRQLGSATPACSDRVSAIPALTPPLNFSARARPAAAGSRSPGIPPTPAGNAPAAALPPGRVGGTAFGAPRPVFVVAGDGKLHLLNSSNGSDQSPALDFLPANSKASALTLHDGVLYTTTSTDCGGRSAVWAIDLSAADPKPVSFPLTTSGGVSGGASGYAGGYALGSDGTVFVRTGSSTDGALVSLSPKDLKLKQTFAIPGGVAGTGAGATPATPVVFSWKEREMVVAAGKGGSLYLLDAKALGGDDAKTPLYQTAALSSGGVWGGLSSWADADGTRWILAPVWGPLSASLKSLLTSGEAPNGSIVAFKLEELQGKPALTPAWVSRDMRSPEPPVITSGVVFALAAGKSSPATLYALDGATGQELYSTGAQVTAPANLTGLTVANGRVYFTTTDGTLYAFGIFLER